MARPDVGRINKMLYKTELCRSWMEMGGYCSYGIRCQYAHGYSELRVAQRHPKYKTEHCQSYLISGKCNYGARCHFLHDEYERMYVGGCTNGNVMSPMMFPTPPNYWQQPHHGQPTIVYYQPMVQHGVNCEMQSSVFSTSFDSECSHGGDSTSDHGDLEPFKIGFSDPKTLLDESCNSSNDGFSPFDSKHEVLGDFLGDLLKRFKFEPNPRLPTVSQRDHQS